jgi:putative phosphoribosyl transferase
MYKTPFLNRQAAGRELGRVLQPRIEGGAAVLGISGGGMAVAAETARYLNAELYPLAVHKLRIPGHDDLSMGALAPQGVQWLDHDLIGRLGITEDNLQKILHREMLELRRSQGASPNEDGLKLIGGRTAVIIDDGISNNSHNILAAIEFVRRQGPQRLLIAAPVIASGAATELAAKCEGLVCLCRPDIFIAADYWFQQPTQTRM